MIAIVASWLARPAIKYGLIALAAAVLFLGGVWGYNSIYNKGSKAGESQIIDAVQSKTIEATTKARQEKDKADDAVRNAPYSDNVDGLR